MYVFECTEVEAAYSSSIYIVLCVNWPNFVCSNFSHLHPRFMNIFPTTKKRLRVLFEASIISLQFRGARRPTLETSVAGCQDDFRQIQTNITSTPGRNETPFLNAQYFRISETLAQNLTKF